MNWLDEGALYSQIALLLREDLGRGDITSQAIIARNTRARGRFIAGEKMIVAGLEAAEEVFLTLDSQHQLEAFVSDGEEVEAAKVIARVSGFADVLLGGERVAVNLIQRLSAIATFTNDLVNAVAGTGVQIVDSRETTPGLRMLEKYAVLLAGGASHRFGLDDGVLITANHISMTGELSAAVATAKSKLGHLHKIQVQVSNSDELREAIDNGADMLLFANLTSSEVESLAALALEKSSNIVSEYTGNISVENVRRYAEAGVNLISVGSLINMRPVTVEFRMQPA
jgi:nicotinate-nucleotide pyrophosphorylase (carboxylating)